MVTLTATAVLFPLYIMVAARVADRLTDDLTYQGRHAGAESTGQRSRPGSHRAPGRLSFAS